MAHEKFHAHSTSHLETVFNALKMYLFEIISFNSAHSI